MAEVSVVSLIEKYKNFVKENPLVASELEVALRWISYLAAGRFTQSAVISELMHSVSNLLTLVNDSILRKAANIPVHVNAVVKQLQTTLSVIEYVEVFAEVAARQLGGARIRWIIIVAIQLIKALIRLILVFKYKQGIQMSPPIPVLNRRIDVPQFCVPTGKNQIPSEPCCSNVEVTFTLKRSGRVIRTLEAAPPLTGRTWKLPKLKSENKYRNNTPMQLNRKLLIGEILHISRPLVHLTTMGTFGEFSWKPWFVTLGMDATSLHLLRRNENLNYTEKLEISRRALGLLVYLLRSPFYDQFSKVQILYTLRSLADSVRGFGLLLRPLIEYVPEWQKTYFYTWAL